MSAEVFPIGIFVIAVCAGLLAVFGVWVSKRIAKEETRSQGITVAALVAGIVLLGLLMTRVSVQPQAAQQPQPPMHSSASPSTGFTGRVSSDNGAQMEIHSESNFPAQVHYQAPVAQGRMSTWAIVVIVVGGIVFLIISRKSLPAAMAGLALIAGLTVMFAYSSHEMRTASTPSPPVMEQRIAQPSQSVAVKDTISDHGVSAVTEIVDVSPAKSESRSEHKGEPKGESSADNVAATPNESPAAEKDQPRPSWVGQPAKLDKSTGVYRMAVMSGPYATEDECDMRLDEKLRGAVMQYAERHMGVGAGIRLYAYDSNYAREKLIAGRYVETIHSQILGRPMVQLHALVEIDANDRSFFEARYRDAEVRERVAITGTFAASLIGVLAVAYGALRYFGCKKPSAEPAPAAPTETMA